MKKLRDLNPEWVGQLRPNSGEGISLDCPVCGPTHRLVAYFSNPLDGKEPAPWGEKWKRTGSAFDVLLVEPSLDYEQCFHGWIEYGLVFQQSESPLVVPMQTDKGFKLVALSPNQALTLCGQVIQKVNDMRYAGLNTTT
jgi:hypothetical protein